MEAKEIEQLTHEELLDKYRKSKEELFHLRFQLATGQLEKTHRLNGVRRDIARVLTFLARHDAAEAAKKKAAAPAPVAPAPAKEKKPKAKAVARAAAKAKAAATPVAKPAAKSAAKSEKDKGKAKSKPAKAS